MAYKVTAPLVIAQDQDGQSHHVYEGGHIQWLSDAQAAHFLSEKLVEKVDDGAGDSSNDAPPKGAAKEVWVDYAVDKGYDRDEVEALSKADIQALDFA